MVTGLLPDEASRLGLQTRDWKSLLAEAVGLLSRLIAIDTSNPPGNETALARVLQDYLERRGLRTRLLGDDPARMNLVSSLGGATEGSRLVLLSHSDVVPARESEWRVAPFSGDVHGGFLWGRGALDMKNQIAAHAVALARLARSGTSFAGKVSLVVTSDEEVGDSCGALWLLERYPGLVACDYLITESVLPSFRVGGVAMLPLSTGEKTFAHLRLRCSGEGGHASTPFHLRNPLARLGEMLARLDALPLLMSVTPSVAQYAATVAPGSRFEDATASPERARVALRGLALSEPAKARLLEALLAATLSPTLVTSSSSMVNVVPTDATVDLDCRLPVGLSVTRLEARIREALSGFAAWELSRVDVVDGNESPAESPLRAAILRASRSLSPSAAVWPLHSNGFTDAHWFREAIPDVVAYGFCPSFTRDGPDDDAQMHAPNERIRLEDIGLQALCYEQIMRELLG